MYYVKLTFRGIPRVMFAHSYSTSSYNMSFPIRNNLFEITFIEQGDIKLKYEGLEDSLFIPQGCFSINLPQYSSTAVTADLTANHVHTTVGIIIDCNCEVISQDKFMEYMYLLSLNKLREEQTVIIPVVYSPSNDKAEKLLKEIIKEFTIKNTSYDIFCSAKCLEILACIFKDCISEFKLKGQEYIPPSDTLYSKKAIEYLDNNYRQNITLLIIANYVGLNPRYLITIFKKNTGYSVIEYLNRYRISKAKEILTDNTIKLPVICKMVGIDDVNYFSRMFKKYVGISPKYYRIMLNTQPK